MSKTQLLRMMITERLLEASVEIFGVVERTIAEYEEEVRSSKRENAHQRELLAVLLKPEIKLHRADFQKFTLSKKEVPPEQQHCEQEEKIPSPCQEEAPEPPQDEEEVPPERPVRISSLGQEEPEPTQVKEEEGDLWNDRDCDPFSVLKGSEADAPDSVLSFPASGDAFPNVFSQRYHYQTVSVDQGEGEAVATTSTAQRSVENPVGEMGLYGPTTEGNVRELAGTGDHAFTCHVCFKGFSNKSRLKLHMMTHSGAKSFGCGICGKRFTLKHYLSAHMKVHTGEKPFGCSVCSNRFTHSSNLKTHMRTHTGEKPFTCSVCGKSFAKNINLKYHVMTHTDHKPFVCQVCGKGFYQLRYLKQHLNTHTVETPYVCCVCDAAFSQQAHLTYHMETHVG